MKTTVVALLLSILPVAPALGQSQSDDIGLVYRVCTTANQSSCATPPTVVSAPDPVYTEEARRAKTQGTVTLVVTVGSDGTVKSASVRKSLDAGLDQQAILAVKKWTFRPAKSNGKPVAVIINVEVNFKLFGGQGNTLSPVVAATKEMPEASNQSSEILSIQDVYRTYSEAFQAYQSHEFRRSIALAKQVATKLPSHGEVWNLLGLDYVALQELPDAESAFLRQIEVNPQTLYAYNNLGRVYRIQKRYEDAAGNFRKQIELNPKDVYAHTNLAATLYELGRYQDALAELNKAAEITPNNGEIPFVRGECQLELGRKDEALKSFDAALSISPAPPAWNSVAWTLAKHGVELDLAEQYAQSAVSAMTAVLHHVSLEHVESATFGRPASLGAFWDTLGYIKFLKGDLHSAQDYLDSAWQLEQRPDVGKHMGELYEKLGKAQDASQQYALTLAAGAKIEHKSRDEADALRFAEDRLKALVPKESDRSVVLADGRTALEQLETLTVPNPDRREAKSELAILIANGSVTEAKVLGDDSILSGVITNAAKWPITQKMPTGVTAQIVRRGELVCRHAETTCKLSLLSTDEAARRPVPTRDGETLPIAMAKKPATEISAEGGKLSGRSYSSETLGLQMVLPEDWILVKESAPTASAMGTAMFGKPGALSFIVVAKERLEASPETYLKVTKAGLKQQDSFQELGESSVARDGMEGVRWNCKWQQQGVLYRAVIDLFSSGDQHFRLMAAAPDDMFDRYAHELDESLRSVKFPGFHVSAKDLPQPQR